ncbi:MAG: hypothetical protein ACUVWR_04240 [Anaerolineae bacterium]
MVAKAAEELEALARRYVADHFPALKDGLSSRTLRQAKTPGAPKQYVFDFRGTEANSTQRLRLVLDGEGKVVKVTASR